MTKPQPATATERARRYRAARAAEGVAEIRGLYAPAADHARLKATVRDMMKRQPINSGDKTVQKIVLDQFGDAWGYVEVAPSVREVQVFHDATIEGAPVDVKTRKVSAAQKYETQLERRGGFATFGRYEHNGRVYYRVL